VSKLNGTGLHSGGGLFRTGVVDPPWPYKTVANHTKLSGYVGKAGSEEYEMLSIADLAALPVGQLIDQYLFLWVPGPHLRAGFDLFDAWGFQYATATHWLKKTATGKVPYGAGYWYRGAVETILVGKKTGAPSVRTQQRNVFEALRLGHSTKPEVFQDHVEQYFPGPYVELFARRNRPGWVCLGDECPGDGGDIRVTLFKVLDGSFPITPAITKPQVSDRVDRKVRVIPRSVILE
jgi:N6-adenosine-specific RNA methylase IME4